MLHWRAVYTCCKRNTPRSETAPCADDVNSPHGADQALETFSSCQRLEMAENAVSHAKAHHTVGLQSLTRAGQLKGWSHLTLKTLWGLRRVSQLLDGLHSNLSYAMSAILM